MDYQKGNHHGFANIGGIYYGWGDNSLNQQGADGHAEGFMVSLTKISEYIKSMSEGFSKIIVAGDTNYILSNNGNAYVWGSNSQGKAGIGSTVASGSEPTKLDALSGKAVSAVIPGRNHIIFTTHTGDVYAVGDNLYGQLGLGAAQAGNSKLTTPVVTAYKFSDEGIIPDTPVFNISAKEVETGKNLSVKWSDVGAAKYILTRVFTPAKAPSTPVSKTVYEGSNTSATDTFSEPGKVKYSIQAVSASGDASGTGTSGEITVRAKPPDTPALTIDVTEVEVGKNLAIKWSSVSAAKYVLTRVFTPEKATPVSKIVYEGSNTSANDSFSEPGKVQYSIKAIGTTGESSGTGTSADITVKAKPPDTPAFTIDVTEVEAGKSFTLKWSDVGAAKYIVERIFTPKAPPSTPVTAKIYEGPNTTCPDSLPEAGKVNYTVKAVGATGVTSSAGTTADITVKEADGDGAGDGNGNGKYSVIVSGGTGGGKYKMGDLVSVSANPAPDGKLFDRWISADGSVVFSDALAETTSFVMPSQNVAVSVSHKDKVYTVTVSGGVGGGEYKEGSTVSLQASPSQDGKEFDRWTADIAIINPQSEYTSFTMPPRNVSAIATYKGKAYNAIIIGGSGSGGYAEGEKVTITASPAPEEKTFTRWASSDGVDFDNETSETASFLMPSRNVAVSAQYAVKTYPVTVSDGSGGGDYKPGATVSIAASPAPEGSIFDRWVSSDDALILRPLAERTSFIMPSKPFTAVATYKDKLYTATISCGMGGGSYKEGAEVAITANPAPDGKQFDRWTSAGGAINFSNPMNDNASFTMPARNVTINAAYKDKTYTVTVSGGTGEGAYKAGANVLLSADPPKNGMVFSHWSSADVAISSPQSEQVAFKMPERDVAVIASYAGRLYTATVINGTGGGGYNEGAAVYLTANPAPAGKQFDKWISSSAGVKIDDDTNESAAFIMPAGNVIVTAAYTDKLYNVVVNEGKGGGEYKEGSTVSIEAAPASAKKAFDKWISSDSEVAFSSQAETASFKMPAKSITVSATYKEKLYALTVKNGSGSGSYKEGDIINIAANQAEAGSRFDKWLTSGGIIADAKSEHTSFTMPAKDTEITAIYTGRAYPVAVSGGTGSGDFTAGSIIQISADPAPVSSLFDKWLVSGDVKLLDPFSEKTSFIMPQGPVTVMAAYKDKLYSLVVNNGAGSGSYKDGAEVYLTANPAPAGKQFSHWSANGGIVEFSDAKSETASLKMPARNISVGAVFVDKTYTVTVSGGTGEGSYKEGAKVPLKANPPEKDMEFDKWVCDGAAVMNPAAESTVITMPAKDVAVIAIYKGKTYSVAVANGTGGGEYNPGVTVFITAAPTASGKEFDRWGSIGDTVAFDNDKNESASFIMPAKSVAVKALYKDKLYVLAVTGGKGGGSYKENETVTVKANTAPAGKQFDKWASDAGFTLPEPQNASMSFKMPARNVNLAASFTERLFKLTVTNGQGGGLYKEDADVIITADAAPEGRKFDKWTSAEKITFTSGNARNEYPRITMPGNDMTVVAVYKDAPDKNDGDDESLTDEQLNRLIASITGSNQSQSDQIARLIAEIKATGAGASDAELSRLLNELSRLTGTQAVVVPAVSGINGASGYNSTNGANGSNSASTYSGPASGNTGGNGQGNLSNKVGSESRTAIPGETDMYALIQKAIETGSATPELLALLPGLVGNGGENGNERQIIMVADSITISAQTGNGENATLVPSKEAGASEGAGDAGVTEEPAASVDPTVDPTAIGLVADADAHAITAAAIPAASSPQEVESKINGVINIIVVILLIAAAGFAGYFFAKRRDRYGDKW
ncbi:MAG: hypothetical protein LBS19_11205 [Clostridiales bacterium]|jgi:hypothetical protein|nr:hypothetical protein [Clostridiales bacterium]